MSGHVTILGCGSSGGVPRVGNGWGACDPGEPRNRRRRCSILVERQSEQGTTSVLVDTGPDLREQLLGARVTRLDGVVYTHDHADHSHGIDDLRPLVLAMRRRVPIHADDQTLAVLRSRFGYCFESPPGSDYPPILEAHRLEPEKMLRIDGPGGIVGVLPIPLVHGNIDALGFRFGAMAYTPDVSAIPEASEPYLADLDLWIIDALRPAPHPSHFSLSDALAWIARMKPKRAVLTNLHSDLDYGRLRSELPPEIEPAFDGMSLAVDLTTSSADILQNAL